MSLYFASTKLTRDALSLTASEEVPTFEVGNLLDPLGTSRWRSTSTAPNIVGQFDIERTPDVWGNFYHNAVSNDWARLRLADTQAELLTNPTLEEFAYMWPGSGPGFFGAYSFDGTANVNYGNILDQSTSSFSIQIRAKRTATGTTEHMLSKAAGAVSTNAGFEIFQSVIPTVRAKIGDGSDVGDVSSVTQLSTTAFLTVTIVIDQVADLMKLYIGDTEEDSVDISLVGSISNANDLLLGESGLGANGIIDLDEFRFWSVALVPSDISAGGKADFSAQVSATAGGLELYWRANSIIGTVAVDETTNNDGTITNGSWSNADIPAISPPLSDLPFVHQSSIIASPVAGSWFRIDYSFVDNPLGYVEIGAIPLDTRFVPERGQQFGWQFMPIVRALHEVELSGGGVDRGGGTFKRDLQLVFNVLTKSEVWGTIRPLLQDRARTEPVAIILDDTEQTFAMDQIYFGYLDWSSISFNEIRHSATVPLIEP